MYVFEHRSKKSEKPLWMGKIFYLICYFEIKIFQNNAKIYNFIETIGSSHGNELYYLFGVPFFNESRLIDWYGYKLNERYFNTEDQEISNYTMHLFVNFVRW